MNPTRFLRGLWGTCLTAIFPPKCLVCDGPYAWQVSADKSQSGCACDDTAPYLCESCRKSFTPISSPFCSRCGLPFVSREGEDHRCSECLLDRRYFRKARAFGVYEGVLLEAIHLLKYGKKTSLSRPLSILAKNTFLQYWDARDIDLIIPVPLHIKRLRERGFNQAHLLLRTWARYEAIPLNGLTLTRTRWTEPQTSLSRAERRNNIKGAFSLRHAERIRDKRILLVDDVYTTGATVNECARVLLKARATFVDVLTLARAV